MFYHSVSCCRSKDLSNDSYLAPYTCAEIGFLYLEEGDLELAREHLERARLGFSIAGLLLGCLVAQDCFGWRYRFLCWPFLALTGNWVKVPYQNYSWESRFLDTSLKCIDREDLGRRRAGTNVPCPWTSGKECTWKPRERAWEAKWNQSYREPDNWQLSAFNWIIVCLFLLGNIRITCYKAFFISESTPLYRK